MGDMQERVVQATQDAAASGTPPEIVGFDTSEANTGQNWIDDRPIYRKVLTFAEGPDGASPFNLPHGISGGFDLVRLHGMMKAGSGASATFFPLPYLNANNTGHLELLKVEGDVSIVGQPDVSYSEWSGFVVLEYVKDP